MVLMMNPKVGLTVLTSSFMIFFTIVVLPALSSPLRFESASQSAGPKCLLSQHQNSHLLVLQPGFAKNGKHGR